MSSEPAPTRIWQNLVDQVAFGPRFCGSPGHRRLQVWIDRRLRADARLDHRFTESFFGESVECVNFVGRYEGQVPGRILLGTHYDTRPWADEDPDLKRRRDPVLGANDGASGVALLMELAGWLLADRERPTVDLVFFDAEDWHGIDGKQVSLGAERFAQVQAQPDAVVVVDMIAAQNLSINFDVSVVSHPPSLELTFALHRLGRALGLSAFSREPRLHQVTDDHLPFLTRGVPSCLLIDMDFPQWHTVSDTLEVCDARVVAEIGTLLMQFLKSGETG
ncbi:MAG: M28 family peptidase [Myxococcota bacterium]